MGKKKASKDKHAGATPAIAALDDAGVAYETVTYEHDDRSELGFGMEAAEKLREDPAHLLKTLLVGEGGEAKEVGVCVLPADHRLDLKAAAHALGMKKVALIDPSAAERITGYVVGGISPLGQKKRLPTVVDASVEGAEHVLVSGGRRGMSVRVAPADLVAVTGGSFAALTV